MSIVSATMVCEERYRKSAACMSFSDAMGVMGCYVIHFIWLIHHHMTHSACVRGDSFKFSPTNVAMVFTINLINILILTASQSLAK